MCYAGPVVEENRKLKLIIGGLAVLLLGGGGCVCLSFGWLGSLVSEDMDNEIVATREGASYGETRSTDECIHEGHARASLCSDIEALCIVSAKNFLSACLSAVAQPDLTICAGAPASPAFLIDDDYGQRIGARYGWNAAEDGPAIDVVSELERWCALNR